MEVFLVVVRQLDMLGQPGTLKIILWILGRKYDFRRLLAFLLLCTKYFFSFSNYDPFLLRFGNIFLLVSTKLRSILSLKETSL